MCLIFVPYLTFLKVILNSVDLRVNIAEENPCQTA